MIGAILKQIGWVTIPVAVLIALLLKTIESATRVKASAIVNSILKRKTGKLYPPRSGMIVDRAHCMGRDSLFPAAAAKSWQAFCEFKDVPKSVSCVYSFPMLSGAIFREVFSSENFPLSVMGVIHAGQVVEQFAKMDDIGAYDHKVWVSASKDTDVGAEVDITIEVSRSVDSKLINRTTMTLVSTDSKKARKAKKARKPLTDEEKCAKTQLEKVKEAFELESTLGGDKSLKYAAVSGDTNPIHHPTYCKAMGMPKPIMHGLWSLGRAVAAVSDKFDLPSKDTMYINAAWKLPLPVPGTANFEYGELDVGACSKPLQQQLSTENTKKFGRHVEFLVTRSKKSKVGAMEKLPHLRGVVSF
jgi:acyl dehydratase